jgi:glycosyltransferase involved in cell wall biosynthesis
MSATLVPANDEKALAQAMCEAPRQANTQALRARVIERYSVARMAQSYAMVYRDVWQGHGRAAA